MPYDRTNSGVLGRNKRKEKDSHPDHTGHLNVEGIEYWVNAWIKENKSTGEKFFSLSIKPKQDQHSTGGVRGNPPSEFDDPDQIPF